MHRAFFQKSLCSKKPIWGIFSQKMGHFFLPRGWQPWTADGGDDGGGDKTGNTGSGDKGGNSGDAPGRHSLPGRHLHVAKRHSEAEKGGGRRQLEAVPLPPRLLGPLRVPLVRPSSEVRFLTAGEPRTSVVYLNSCLRNVCRVNSTVASYC